MIDINHIAKLARLGLKEEEKNKLEAELSAILDFVGKLKKADTAKIEPMTGGTILSNVVREDEANPKDPEEQSRILNNVPKRKDDYIEIPAVFE